MNQSRHRRLTTFELTKRKEMVEMRNTGLYAMLLALALMGFLSGCGQSEAKHPVIGIAECRIFADAESKSNSTSLPAGTGVKVLSVSGETVQIEYSNGSGWVDRYALCSQEEYERREQAEEIPERVVTIVYGDGRFYLMGGTISIGNNRPTASPGQGFWMDSSTEGHPFSIASVECWRGDHLHFINKESKVVQLPVWK